MKTIFTMLASVLVFTALAEPVRITGFESKDGRFSKVSASGNAASEVISSDDVPEGTCALKITFGGRNDIAKNMKHWGFVRIPLPVKKIPQGAKVIRFWVKGTPAKGYGVLVRLGKFFHRGTQNDKNAWIDFADGDWFQYECALKDFIPEKKDAGNGGLKDFSGISHLTIFAIADWQIKAPNRKEQVFFIDLVEVE